MGMDLIDHRDLGTAEGFDIRVELYPDFDSTPYDADCYSDEDILAWQRDLWNYVVIIVTASIAGHELGWWTLGGIEHGDLATVSVDALDLSEDGIIKHSGAIDEAISHARREAPKLAERLKAIHDND